MKNSVCKPIGIFKMWLNHQTIVKIYPKHIKWESRWLVFSKIKYKIQIPSEYCEHIEFTFQQSINYFLGLDLP